METGNREEAERAIRENRKLHKAPDEIDTRRDTVGRSKQKRVKSIIDQEPAEMEADRKTAEYEERPYPQAGAFSTSDDEGVHGTAGKKFGVEAYSHAPEVVVPDATGEDAERTAVFTPNDDMSGQGWTPPTSPEEGWSRPEEPAPEERLHEEEEPDTA
jgi:hypothetical protein